MPWEHFTDHWMNISQPEDPRIHWRVCHEGPGPPPTLLSSHPGVSWRASSWESACLTWKWAAIPLEKLLTRFLKLAITDSPSLSVSSLIRWAFITTWIYGFAADLALHNVFPVQDLERNLFLVAALGIARHLLDSFLKTLWSLGIPQGTVFPSLLLLLGCSRSNLCPRSYGKCFDTCLS